MGLTGDLPVPVAVPAGQGLDPGQTWVRAPGPPSTAVVTEEAVFFLST